MWKEKTIFQFPFPSHFNLNTNSVFRSSFRCFLFSAAISGDNQKYPAKSLDICRLSIHPAPDTGLLNNRMKGCLEWMIQLVDLVALHPSGVCVYVLF